MKCKQRRLTIPREPSLSLWRWRESNPRPKSSSQSFYKLSRSLSLASAWLDRQSCRRRAVLAFASLAAVTGVAAAAPQLGCAQRPPFGGERTWTSQL